jgi:GNAT superfamily N-acetyltransferase
VFRAGRFDAVELRAGDVPRLQAFFDANPAYSLAVEGRAPPADAAQTEFDARLPENFVFTRRWLLAFDDASGAMAGVADVVSDLLAPSVWHISLFIVATALHGRGTAQALYAALENWMRAGGAAWIRLGVVAGNARAERFWQRLGYAETRVREGIAMGERVNTVRVLVKGFADGDLAAYLECVPRDRPGAP